MSQIYIICAKGKLWDKYISVNDEYDYWKVNNL